MKQILASVMKTVINFSKAKISDLKISFANSAFQYEINSHFSI